MQMLTTDDRINKLWAEVKDIEEIWGDLKGSAREWIKTLIGTSFEQGIRAYVGAGMYERAPSRVTQRNGYYNRSLETELGLIEGIAVPRTRDGGWRPSGVFQRYKRRQKGVNKILKEMFLAGVSTRRVGEVLGTLLGYKPSAQSVSEATKVLDYEVRKYHTRPLADCYRYLLLDGVVLRLKGPKSQRKRVILCAYGITAWYTRELIDFQTASKETEAEWTRFLNSLYQRGVRGQALELIVSDGGKGLIAALDMVYPHIPRQRCWVHKLRNVANYVRKKDREEVLKGAKEIYQASNRPEALRRYERWARSWKGIYPNAVECLEKDLEQLLRFLDFPLEHHRKIRTTNAIERAFREVRRRTRPISCFNDTKSCERIVFGVFSYLNKKWKERPIKNFNFTQFS